MKRFAELFKKLDQSFSTLSKVESMTNYFKEVSAGEAAWACWFLSGHRLKRFIKSADLKRWTMEFVSISPWLFEECYSSVGDLAEVITLLVEGARPAKSTLKISDREYSDNLADWIEQELLALQKLEPEQQKERVILWWKTLEAGELLLANKLLLGSFRVGVSQGLLLKALEKLTGLSLAELTRRLMGEWKPSVDFWKKLFEPISSEKSEDFHPYPFYLASPLEGAAQDLGDIGDWLIEWKWDGIRAQWVKRNDAYALWSRGEELMTERFPELDPKNFSEDMLLKKTSCVLDGEILAVREGFVMPFQLLQQRISRKKLGPKILQECPVIFLAYDLLEYESIDLRAEPMRQRRSRLETLLHNSPPNFRISPSFSFSNWEEAHAQREKSREQKTEGLMLKHFDSPYQVGRKRGFWWKWKISPLTLDVVLMYAQPGHGRRAGLYTDYTFGLWKEGQLVPVAKAYSGLDQSEIEELDRWIRRNVEEKFGPVRSVKKEQVFEIAFEGLAESTRHRSGIALRFPRILRWRRDKKPEEADTLENALGLLKVDS